MRIAARPLSRLFLLALAAVMTPAANPAAAEPTQIPAGRIVIDVPGGYALSKQFAGFINDATGASIVTIEMPAAAFADFKKSDFAARLAANGFANVQPGTLDHAGQHLYVTAEQATSAGAFAKFLLILADAKTTAMVTVNVLKSDIVSGRTSRGEIERMLRTVSLAAEPAAALPAAFRFAYLGPFKAAGVKGGAHLFTLDGRDVPEKPEPGRALFVAAPSLSRTPVVDLAASARMALATLFDLEAATHKREATLVIDGREAHEIEIEAPRKPAGPRAVAYQMMVRTADGYIRMLGTASADGGRSLLEEFRKIATSYQAAAPK